MKYTAVNDYVIVEKERDKKTESGIIIHQEESYIKRAKVVATNTKALMGKTVVVEGRNFIDFGDGFGAVQEKNITAVVN